MELKALDWRTGGSGGGKPYRFWLLAHTVQNLSLNLLSGTVVFLVSVSLAPSMAADKGSTGGGGGGGGAAAACCCCLARRRGSADMVRLAQGKNSSQRLAKLATCAWVGVTGSRCGAWIRIFSVYYEVLTSPSA